MKLGILSDTHEDRDKATPHIIAEFKRRNVDAVIHCGDINFSDVNSELFGNLPVFCALTDEQVNENKNCPIVKPANWKFTYPNKRIVDIGPHYSYLGHKLSFDFLINSQHILWAKLNEIRKDFHNVRSIFSGHTHHQILMRSGLIDFINPGAVTDSFGAAGGNEFATLDTTTGEIVFSRIQRSKPTGDFLKVAVISGTLDVSKMNPSFWPKLAEKLSQENVTHIIHCGNIYTDDIGIPELSKFEIFYNLRADQDDIQHKPGNWKLIPGPSNEVVQINGYKFCVQLAMGPEIVNRSESQMHEISMKILSQYPEVIFHLCGSTWTSFLEEGQGLVYLNPGDASRNSNYAIIELPRYEITFGTIQQDPLPLL